MSKDNALDELIRRLEYEAAQIEMAVTQQTQSRDRIQRSLDNEEGRLLDKQELIEFLKASAEEVAEPYRGWRVGDRFSWKWNNTGGTVVARNFDGAQVGLRFTDGTQITMPFDDFVGRADRA